MATKTKTAKKPNIAATKPRKLKQPNYQSFRLSKRIKHPGTVPGAFRILGASIRHIWSHKKLFAGITAVYLVLTVLFVKGLGVSGEVSELRETVDELFSGGNSFLTGLTLYGLLVGSSGTASSDVGGLYQTILLILVSLAVIWALRQTHAKEKISTKESFYRGMYPLIPFLLVLMVIGLQLVPMLLGSTLYSIVSTNGLAVTGLEQLVWALLFGMLALLSLYMVSSSVFALYIVTLPDVTPMQALRSARELVRHRRWTVMRKVFFLPVVLIVGAAFIMIPMLLVLTVVAEYVFFVMTMFALAVVHSYLYTLYRELM